MTRATVKLPTSKDVASRTEVYGSQVIRSREFKPAAWETSNSLRNQKGHAPSNLHHQYNSAHSLWNRSQIYNDSNLENDQVQLFDQKDLMIQNQQIIQQVFRDFQIKMARGNGVDGKRRLCDDLGPRDELLS